MMEENKKAVVDNSLAGVNVLLMGPAGTGKTYSIGSLVETGLEVFFVAIETGLESLSGYFVDNGKPIPDNLHWHFLAGPKADFSTLLKSSQRVNSMSFEVLSKAVDPNKSDYDQCHKFLECLTSFVDDRTGKDYGDVGTWGTDRVIVIDGLTGISSMYLSNVIGGKSAISLPDWMVAQRELLKLLRMLCDNCRCHVVLLGHVDREVDNLMQSGSKLIVSSLGKALSPLIPPMFSDVILTVREGDKFYWDTAATGADVKTRNLPIKSGLVPDFKQIINKWRSRNTGGTAITE